MVSDLVTLAEVRAAAAEIDDVVRRTPLLGTTLGTSEAPLHVKAESLQLTGSFKVRGATRAVRRLGPDERGHGVITHSSGNHAQAVARAAAAEGIACTVVMPRSAPAVKREATKALGATVVLVEPHERETVVARIRAVSGAAYVPPFNDPNVIAGQGTAGLEILEQLPDLACVLVPVSGGGLLSGIAAAVKQTRADVRVIGVEPELAGDLAEGFARGQRVTWNPSLTARTVADGLRVSGVGELNWRHIQAYVDDVVTVTEAEILAAMRALVLHVKLVCEPSGAVATAGYLRHLDGLPPGPAVAVVSGGNVEAALLRAVLVG